jgi:hypothetical protein
MKLIILRLDSANKPWPMSEGVLKIRINSQPCKGIKPDNMTHTSQEDTMSRNSSWHDQRFGPGPTSP